MSRRPIAALALLVLAALTHSARADVLVVDFSNGPGSDYEFLSQAVDAAQDGDVLLLRPGNYDIFNTVDGRSLTVLADGDNVTVRGVLTVTHLALGQRVVLRGFTFGYPGSLELHDNDGVVFVEGCTVLADQQSGAGENAGILAVDSRLVISSSAVNGSLNYAEFSTPPTPGVLAIRSEIVLSGSTVRGGDGNDPYDVSVPGAAGLSLDDSSVTARGSTLIGGFGDTEVGGTGLVALNGSSLHLQQCTVAGGAGSPTGAAQSVDGSSMLLTLPGVAHSLTSASPVREGASSAITVHGAPGNGVWLALSLGTGWTPVASGHSVLVVGLPFQLVPLGTLGAGGELSLPFVAPDLPVGLQAIDLFLQDLHTGSGLKVAGPATVLTLMDASL